MEEQIWDSRAFANAQKTFDRALTNSKVTTLKNQCGISDAVFASEQLPRRYVIPVKAGNRPEVLAEGRREIRRICIADEIGGLGHGEVLIHERLARHFDPFDTEIFGRAGAKGRAKTGIE